MLNLIMGKLDIYFNVQIKLCKKLHTLLDELDTVFVCNEDFGWPVIFGRFGSTVGVEGAEVLRSELGFMCWFLRWLENGNADMMKIFILVNTLVFVSQ